jgi:hypothetical protein
MGALCKTLRVLVLTFAVGLSVVLGAVFPVPPIIVMSRRRRTDRTELVLPATPGRRLDLSRTQVPASLLLPQTGW